MARLYADENFSLPVVTLLRQKGHDVLTSRDDGKANQGIDDASVLAQATQQDRILITFNRNDFIQLHKSSNAHAGIIVCKLDPDQVALSERIHHQLLQAESTLPGQLRRINRHTD
jgi:predicted nuclease of predicted toxin-antitoxin system